MIVLGLLTRNEIFWWVAIGVGFAVVAIVAALMILLLSILRDIDQRLRGAGGVAEAMAERPERGGTAAVAASTGTVEALRREVEAQRRLLHAP